MNSQDSRVEIDWGHIIVLAMIAGATLWYIFDARAVSTDTNNLLLIQPLSIVTLLLCAFVLRQCVRRVSDHPEAPAIDPTAPVKVDADDVNATNMVQPALPTDRVEVIKMLAFAALLGGFVFAMQPLGFDVAMFLFCLIGMAICGERRPLPLIAFPLIVTFVIIYGFRALMPYPMPTTIL